ncbi:MAG: NADH:ubiquinone oxidoreductase [Candidatus Methanomethylicota archaeon]|uniref:NADH:ubiquinone oxidoreductase n=1 Tax=Thermoproteota archaeon TaxID=2056631 RepID=A0A497F810_9CREN|nr:MAG: NADH:ubiquinone oxidoreductase [Candidatus Verstraetearchaeota archaeon]
MKSKLKVHFYSLAGCEGCAAQLVNALVKRPELLKHIDFKQFRLIGAREESESCDIAIIDGSITNDEDEKKIMEIRRKAKTLIALGTCAVLGGVQSAVNELNISEALSKVYKKVPKAVKINKVKPLSEAVHVDYEIPGCPAEVEELEKLLVELISGAKFRLSAKSVCFECKLRETACLLDKGEMCLGPIIRSGCNAKCPALGAPCRGCRGLFEDSEVEELICTALEKGIKEDVIKDKLSIFMVKVARKYGEVFEK